MGAALAGVTEGIPSIAISMDGRGPYHFETAIHVLMKVLKKRTQIFSKIHARVLNINIPNVPIEELKGVRLTELGERIWSEEFVSGNSADSFRYHLEDPINFGGSGYDVTEVSDGYASISVLQPSLLDRHSNEVLGDLLQEWNW